MKKIYVVAGVIKNGDEILCMQRKESKFPYISYKYEFPGGKIEENETEQDALRRELFEEMEMEVEIGEKLISIEHAYPDFTLNMEVFSCIAKNKEFKLKEHIAFQWLTKDKLNTLDWAAADIPAVNQLIG